MRTATTWELLRTLAASDDCPEGWSGLLEDCAGDAQRTATRLEALARAVADSTQTVGDPRYPFVGPNVQGG